MDLIVEPDIYSPNIDNDGNYVDKSPSYIHFKNGIRCPCGTRKDKIYECNSYFSNHVKTKTHQKWLFDLNTNKTNYYTENIILKDTINNQKIIIARLEKDKIVKSKTIDILTQQLINKEAIIVTDLLVFD
jgi:hypothetical protein